MAYYINIFSPETYLAYSESNREISGFRERRSKTAANVRPGDKLICYITKLSRWVGVLEVCSDFFLDDHPIFVPANDPFVVRFHVSPKVWLEPETGIPIGSDVCWERLSFTRGLRRNSKGWTGMVRSSLIKLSEEDGRCLEELLIAQAAAPQSYPLTAADRKKLSPSVINSASGPIAVSVPDEEDTPSERRRTETEHTRMQASLAKIGESMGFRIWLPAGDRQRVLEQWRPVSGDTLLAQLPLNYDTVTLKTIAYIDVLWIRRNSIVRAFEVEHSTSIYSGLLRMADLMSLQPNMLIKAHIVAPSSRRAKVFREISRPVFALMEKGPLFESCSFLSYDAIQTIAAERYLSHMNDSILEDYEEYAQESDF